MGDELQPCQRASKTLTSRDRGKNKHVDVNGSRPLKKWHRFAKQPHPATRQPSRPCATPFPTWACLFLDVAVVVGNQRKASVLLLVSALEKPPLAHTHITHTHKRALTGLSMPTLDSSGQDLLGCYSLQSGSTCSGRF